MKRNLLITALLAYLTASSLAQGVIAIGASSGKIKYTTDGVTLVSLATGSPASVLTFGQFNFAVYSASNGTTLPTSGSATLLGGIPDFTTPGWHIQTSAPLHNIGPLTGFVPNTAVNLDALSGGVSATEQLELVAWTGNFATFQAALAAGNGLIGWQGSLLIAGGSSFTLSFATGDGITSTPVVPIVAGTGWNGLVLAPLIPEPGTILLGGLGAAALVLFRHRK